MINLSAEPKSIQSIYRDFSDNKFRVNRKYQRKLVWTLEEKEKLIESILNSFPIPNILLAKTTDSDNFEIIDGMQRLHTIISFIEQSFPYKGKYFDLNNFATAKNRSQDNIFEAKYGDDIEYLDSNECSKILDYSLSVLIMRDVDENIINDVFSRINTYGHRLSEQERRQAGVQTTFSNLVRELGSKLRGDDSLDILLLNEMPDISIELTRARSGYGILADNTFWVKQGILRSTDLRDSKDEQCIADIIASIINGEPISRGKDALDELYQLDHPSSKQINKALEIYGVQKLIDEFEFCINLLEDFCETKEVKLRRVISNNASNNSIPAMFANTFIAIFEILFQNKNNLAQSDYDELYDQFLRANPRVIDGRTPENRRANIDIIKSFISSAFKQKLDSNFVYKNSGEVEIDKFISISVEQPTLEFKQGCLNLQTNNRAINDNLFDKIINTICAIANTGESGNIIIGVADNESDAQLISKQDEITPRKVYRKYVVGVDREAKKLGMDLDDYTRLWLEKIQSSELSENLKHDVLSNFKYIPYYGLGLIIIHISAQICESYVGDTMYWRKIDNTVRIPSFIDEPATAPKQIAEIARRFAR